MTVETWRGFDFVSYDTDIVEVDGTGLKSYQVYIPRVRNMKEILLNDNHGQILHTPYQSKDLLQIKILDGKQSKSSY